MNNEFRNALCDWLAEHGLKMRIGATNASGNTAWVDVKRPAKADGNSQDAGSTVDGNPNEEPLKPDRKASE